MRTKDEFLHDFFALTERDQLNIWEAIKSKMDVHKTGLTIARELASEIIEISNYKLEKILLFGAYARGDQDSSSTIDLMLIGEYDAVGPFHRSIALKEKLHKQYANVNLLCYTTYEFSTNFLMRDKVLSEGIVLYEYKED